MNLSMWFAMKWLWWKHAHPFQWAHKPLCHRFHRETLRLGHLHVCRSCTLLYAGMIGFAAALPWTAGWFQSVGLVPLASVAVVVVGFSAPPVYRHLPRGARDLLRALMGMLLPWTVWMTFGGHAIGGIVLLKVLALFWKAYFAGRSRRKLHECDGCPELAGQGVCSGFTKQAERWRNYEREASELLTRESPPSF